MNVLACWACGVVMMAVALVVGCSDNSGSGNSPSNPEYIVIVSPSPSPTLSQTPVPGTIS